MTAKIDGKGLGWLEDRRGPESNDSNRVNALLKSAVKTKPSTPLPEDKNEPTNDNLWKRVLQVAGGDLKEYRQGDRTINAPNEGRGFDNMPHNPNGIAWAVKQYNGFGGHWKERTAQESWGLRMRRLASGGVEVTQGIATTQARQLALRGILRLAGVQGDRYYWDLTAEGHQLLVKMGSISDGVKG